MRNILALFAILIISTTTVGQNNQIIRMGQPINVEFYKQTLDDLQKNLDNARAYTLEIKNYITSVKRQTNDAQLNRELNTYIKELDVNLDEFRPSIYVIQLIQQKINGSIDNYNARVRESNNPSKYWELAIDNLKKNNISSAFINLSKVIELSPEFPDSYLLRGRIYYNDNDLSSSIRDFDQYIALNNNDPRAYELRGWAKYYQTDYYGALMDFTRQVELDPLSSSAYYNRGSAKSELDNNIGAIADYRKSIEIEPRFSMAYNNLAWSYFKIKKYDEALTYANVSIDLDIENSVAYDTRAEIKFNMGNNKGCIEDCNSAIQLDNELSNSYFLRGRAKYRTDNKIGACEDWRIAGGFGKSEAYEFVSKYCK